jgi:hypothetical protein
LPSDTTIECSDNLPAPGTVTATDNCDTDVNIVLNEQTIPGSCAGSFVVIRTWTATDDCGNSTTAVQTINAGDTESPVFTSVPADETIECSTGVPSPGTVTATDNCDTDVNIVLNEQTIPGSCAGSFIVIRTWTATDDCGNSTTAVQTINAGDTESPVFTSVPADETIECSTGVPAPGTVTATDNCDTDVNIVLNEQTIPGSCAGSFIVIRTWTATDDCGNSTTAVQTINAGDTESPVFTSVPADETIECSTGVPTPGTVTATDNCDTDVNIVLNEQTIPGSCAGSFIVIRTWTATDDCGNSTTAVQTINAGDTESPVFTIVPADETIECSTGVPSPGTVTATDNCDTDVNIVLNEQTIPGSCAGSFVVIRTWTATDDCGNSTTAVQTINAGDTESPVFTSVPADETIECSTGVPSPGTVTATDNCDTDVNIVLNEQTIPGSCAGSFIVIRTWTATDDCGNSTTAVQTINAGDTESPVFTSVPADETIECSTGVPAPGTVTATDNCDTDVNIVLNEQTIPGSCAGSFVVIRTWTATDDCGNSTTAVQTINAGDTESPVFTSVPADETIECSTGVPAPGTVTATDNCDTDVNIVLNEQTSPGSCAGSFVVIRTWTATDDCGNSTTAVQTINAGDTESPVFTSVPADETIECSTGVPSPGTVTATDNCDTDVNIVLNEQTIPGSCAGSFVVIRTWTATDDCGNSSTAVQTINAGDTESPVFTSVPSDETIECSTGVPSPGTVTATDNCDTDVNIVLNEQTIPGSCAGSFVVIRTWTATDDCGNSTTAVQTINAGDTESPVFTSVPADETIECSTGVPSPGTVTATDNCDTDVNIVLNEQTIPGSCAGSFVVIRTWTATDDCGNSTTAVQTINAGDTESPVFTSVPADETIECSTGVPAPGTVTATDNCDTDVNIVLNEQTIPGSCAGSFIVIRTWTATDDCGNSTIAVQTINAGDTESPVFTSVPADETIECSTGVPSPGTVTATDNCDTDVNIVLNEQTIPGSCAGSFVVIRTWTATDDCGNSTTAVQTINAGDTESPVFTSVPADETIECSTGVPTPGTVTATDNCDTDVNIVLNEQTIPGSCAGSFIVIRTWTATDDCGNSTTAVQTINAGDTESPVFTSVPADETIECSTGVPSPGTVTATDNCDTDVNIVLNEQTIPGSCAGSFVVIRTWTATDDCGNSTTAVQTINAGDTESPVFTSVPADETIECSTGVPSPGTVTATDNCDTDVNIVLNEQTIPGSCAGSFIVIRTWTATDDCGNSTTAVQTINAGDTESPVFTSVPADETIECSTGVPSPGTVTATDNCDTDVNIVLNEQTIPGSCAGSFIVIRTWTATDDCGNSTTAVQTINAGDTESPVFTSVPADETIECSTGVPSPGTVTATDNCDTDVNIVLNEQTIPGSCAGSFIVIRTWTATDDCGNSTTAVQTINAGDTESPVFTSVPADETIECSTGVPSPGTVTATDNCDTDVNIVLNEQTIPGSCAGSFVVIRTWTATDDCGNSTTAVQTINAGDTESPVFTIVPADETIECSTGVPSPGTVTATDNCDTDVNIVLNEQTIPGSCAGSFVVIRTWTATDDCGNSTTAVQTINAGDTESPVFTSVPADETIECSTGVPSPGTVTATDNCDTDVNIVLNEQTIPGSCAGSFIVIRTWTATDDCGNSTIAVQTINAGDTESPVFTSVPADETIECSTGVPSPGTVTATDNCDTDVNIVLNEQTIPGSCAGSFIVIRTWTATDDCGNSTTAVQTINAGDTESPVFTSVPADETIECSTGVPAPGTVTATDNCDTDVNIVLNEQTIPGSCAGSFIVIRTWTATDDCGNSTTAVQTINAGDTESPVFTSVPADETIECSTGVPTLGTVTATDNCDTDVNIVLNEQTIPGSCAGSFVVIRTWTAIDDCGNSTTAVQTINAGDTESPVFTSVPADETIECSTGVPAPGTVTATDNCDTDVNIVLNEQTIPGSCAGSPIVIRTWTATDDCGNSTTAVQSINAGDTESPVFTSVPADETIECSTGVPAPGTVTATDNCDTDVNIVLNEQTIPGSCAGSFVVIRTWTATDDCGNSTTAVQTINAGDTESPVFTSVPADETIECSTGVPSPGTVTATDNCDTDVNIVLNEQIIPGSCAGSFIVIRTWTATDDCGNSTTAVQTINAGDTESPVFTSVPADETIECSTGVPSPGTVTATDNCDTDVNIVLNEQTIPGSCAGSFIVIRTWTATDDCGNSTTAVQTINAGDTESPVFTSVPADETIECSTGVPSPGTVTATDNCDTDVNIVFNEQTIPGSCAGSFIVIRTWTATDDCGNSTTAVQSINAGDTESPVFTSVPADETIECSTGVPSPGTVTATDNCDTDVNIVLNEQTIPGSCAGSFIVIRTWTATDDCGNSTTAVQTINAGDTESPVFTSVPADETIECSTGVPSPGTVTATDNCDTDVNIVLNEQTIPGSCAGSFIVIRTWTATDDCGNSTTAVQTINAGDTESPVFTSVPADETIECSTGVPSPGTVTATDNCDTDVNIVLNEQTIPGSCAGSFVVIRTWTATDDCGNSTTAVQTISAGDNEAPMITDIPADETIECSTGVPSPGTVTATDNCDTDVNIVLNEQTIPGSCAGSFIVIRTWTATDDCGNSTTAVQTINAGDTESPVFTSVPADETIECSTGVPSPGTVTATDNCDTDVNIVLNEQTIPGSCAGSFVVIRTWTATDDCGNSTTAVQTISAGDNEAPMITDIPADETIECSTGVPSPGTVTATDNCDNNVTVSLDEQTIPGSCANSFTLIRTWTATDDCGNSTTAVQTISAGDNEAPVITDIPADETIECSTGIPSPGTVTATDNCDNNVTVSLDEQTIPGACANSFTLIRTWTATDDCGNSTTAVQTISAGDNEAPVITDIPADETIECSTGIPSPGTVTATDNCDNNVTVSLVEQTIPGSCANSFTLIRTWTATDDCGNSTTAVQTISAGDNEAPVITDIPADETIECSTGIPSPGTVTATDNCDNNVTVSLDEQTIPGSCANSFTLIRTWTATDDCGNSTTAVQTISAGDNEAPVITDIPADETIECSTGIPSPGMVTATDNCDNNVTVSLDEQTIPGSCANSFTLIRTWTATDDCGNSTTAVQTISAGDNEAPVITDIPADETIECSTGIPSPGTVTATDNCDNNVTVSLDEQTIPGSCANSFTLIRTWTATDDCGNSTTAVQTISAGDNEAPVITDIPADETIECSTGVPSPGTVTATDNCDNNVTVSLDEQTIPGSCANSFTLIRTWTATDDCGNSTTAVQTISAGDNEAPVITDIPADETIECSTGIPSPGTVTATDNCDNNVSVSLDEQTIPGACANSFTLIRTWTATDDCGNSTTAVQTISAGDNEAPVITDIPADETIECSTGVPSPGTVTATDNCDNNVTVSLDEQTIPGSCANSFTLIRTWTATDDCGNSTTAVQTISAGDNEAPVITDIPADETIECSTGIPSPGTVTATDNCDNNVTVSLDEQTIPGSCANSFTLIRTWTATDDCGNSTTAVQTISAGDNEAPMITDIPADETIECSTGVPSPGTVTATDNCDNNVTVSLDEQTIPGSCANSFTLIRTWTATDDCGNSTTAVQTISAGDNEAPVITDIPADETIECSTGIPSPDTVTATDNCDNNVTVSLDEQTIPGSCANSFTLIRTWTATDDCGNSTTAVQTISAGDNEAPVITDIPADETIECSTGIPSPGTVTATDNCDNNVTVSLDEQTIPGSCANSFTLIRTWTATDDCGNSTTAVQTISAGDNEAPVITDIPADETIECSTGIPSPGTVTATDNCDNNVTISLDEQTIPGSCANSFTLIRTWTATDDCGNSTTAVQTISAGDNEAPVITDIPADETIECSTGIPSPGAVTATDNCDNNVTVSLDEQTIPGACANSFTLIRTWTATDDCGNSTTAVQTISAGDNEAPVITDIPADETIECSTGVPSPGTVTATDNCDNNVTVSLDEQTIPGSCANSFTLIRTWTATDDCGNSTTAVQTISAGDNEAPVITDIPADETIECSTGVPSPGTVTATDNCDNNVTVSLDEQTIPGSCTNSFTLIRTWTATDDCGNSTTAVQTISAGDNEAPVITDIPADETIECSTGVPSPGTVTATDNCDNNVTVITRRANHPRCLCEQFHTDPHLDRHRRLWQ